MSGKKREPKTAAGAAPRSLGQELLKALQWIEAGAPGAVITTESPRDPVRIERIVGKLALAWSSAPDQRLGQFLVNLTGKADPLGIRDVEIETRLDTFLATGEQAPAEALR